MLRGRGCEVLAAGEADNRGRSFEVAPVCYDCRGASCCSGRACEPQLCRKLLSPLAESIVGARRVDLA